MYPLTIEGRIETNPGLLPICINYIQPKITKNTSALIPSQMLFTFQDISDRPEKFLRNWFDKASLLEPVYDLYYGIVYYPPTNQENIFLNLIQAIESFHRRIFKGEYIPKKDYEDKVYDILVKAIPALEGQDLKESLESKLRYGNEFSLRTRLRDILKRYNEIMPGFIPDKKDFINKVVDTRNYYTHYDEDLKGRAVSDESLYYLTQRLRRLLEICLLRELGFNLKEIKEFFVRSFIFQRLFTE